MAYASTKGFGWTLTFIAVAIIILVGLMSSPARSQVADEALVCQPGTSVEEVVPALRAVDGVTVAVLSPLQTEKLLRTLEAKYGPAPFEYRPTLAVIVTISGVDIIQIGFGKDGCILNVVKMNATDWYPIERDSIGQGV